MRASESKEKGDAHWRGPLRKGSSPGGETRGQLSLQDHGDRGSGERW